jgi:hypothetical protein
MIRICDLIDGLNLWTEFVSLNESQVSENKYQQRKTERARAWVRVPGRGCARVCA